MKWKALRLDILLRNLAIHIILFGPYLRTGLSPEKTKTKICTFAQHLIVFKALWPLLSPLIFTAVLWAGNEGPEYKIICPKLLS